MYKNHIEEMIIYRSKGLMLQEIADIFGCTRERVRQLIKNTGTTGMSRKTREAILYAKENPSKTINEISEITHTSIDILRKKINNIGHHTIPNGGCAKIGEKAERFISNKLSKLGIDNILMPNHHPFDILINGNIRLDVKSRTKRSMLGRDGRKTLSWTFKNRNNADFFAIVTPEKDVFIIPAGVISCSCIAFRYPGRKRDYPKSKYLQYKDRFDLLTS